MLRTALAGVALWLAPLAHAAPIEGTFVAETSRQEARETADQAIDRALEDVGFFTRLGAKPKLKAATEPCQTLVFEDLGDQLSAACDDRPPAVAPIDGPATTYTDEEGEQLTLTFATAGGSLVQTFAGDQGSRINTYRLDGDTLVLDVRVTSERLPTDVTYTRRFQREGGAGVTRR